VIRVIQIFIQIANLKSDVSARDHAYKEFVKSLKMTDKEYVERILKEFEESEE
jgi:hypothetical protein